MKKYLILAKNKIKNTYLLYLKLQLYLKLIKTGRESVTLSRPFLLLINSRFLFSYYKAINVKLIKDRQLEINYEKMYMYISRCLFLYFYYCLENSCPDIRADKCIARYSSTYLENIDLAILCIIYPLGYDVINIIKYKCNLETRYIEITCMCITLFLYVLFILFFFFLFVFFIIL